MAGHWARVVQVLCDMPPVNAFMPSNVLALAHSLIGPQSNLPDSCRSALKARVHGNWIGMAVEDPHVSVCAGHL